MDKNISFIFLSLQPIDTFRGSTSTNLAREFSKKHKVLYVNSPIDRKSQLKDLFNRKKRPSALRQRLQLLDENLWVLNPETVIESINWIPYTSIFSFFNWINNLRLAKDIKKAVKEIGLEQFIIVNDKDIFRSYYLKELLKPVKYVYLDRDYTLGIHYWKRHGTILEPALMRKSDVVLCNSVGFTDSAKQYNKNSYFIGNGCDIGIFDVEKKWLSPEDLRDIPSPIIGYSGAILSIRLDINIIIEIANLHKDWNIVLIGDEDEIFKASILHQLDNVYFLGRKETIVLPAYISHFDVCINPQIINEITLNNYPLKINEYLAMGKPVVATKTDTMEKVFNDYTYLVDENSSFVPQIEKALAEDSESLQIDRIAFARNNSWDKVAETALNAISNMSFKNEAIAS